VLAALAIKAAAVVRQRGGLRGLLNGRGQAGAAAGGSGAGAAGPQQQRAAGGGGRGPAGRPARPDFDAVAAALQKLPTEVVATRAELEAESVAQLKARLRRVRADAGGCTEKAELVARVLAAGGGSSGEGCAVCAEEYAPGDVVRVLPWCRHRFHIECLDRWLLKSTEHSAPKGCPLCNDERWLSA
jgi:hypothetical protein